MLDASRVQVKIGASLGGNFKSAFSKADEKIQEVTNELRKLHKASNQANTFTRMTNRVKEASLAMENAEKKVHRLTKAIGNRKTPSKAGKGYLVAKEKSNLELAKAKNKYEESQEALERLQTSLRGAGVDTNDLARAQENLARKMTKANESMDKARMSKARSQSRGSTIQGAKSATMGAVGVAAATGAILANPLLVSRELTRVDMLQGDAKGYNPKAMRSKIMEIGKDYSFSTITAAKVAGDFSQAGYSAKDTQASLRSTFDIATASRSEPMEVAQLMRSLTNSFGLKGDKGYLAQKDMQYLSNVMLKASNTSDLKIEDLVESTKYLGAMPKESQLNLKQTTAMLMAMSSQLRGSEAGTSLVQFLEKLNRPATRNKLREQLQLDVMTTNKVGQRVLKNPMEIIELLGKRLQGSKDKMGVLTPIFDTMASRALLPLMANYKQLLSNEKGLDRKWFDTFAGQNKQRSYADVKKEQADSGAYGGLMRVVGAFDRLSVVTYNLIEGPLDRFARFSAVVIHGLSDSIERLPKTMDFFNKRMEELWHSLTDLITKPKLPSIDDIFDFLNAPTKPLTKQETKSIPIPGRTLSREVSSTDNRQANINISIEQLPGQSSEDLATLAAEHVSAALQDAMWISSRSFIDEPTMGVMG